MITNYMGAPNWGTPPNHIEKFAFGRNNMESFLLMSVILRHAHIYISEWLRFGSLESSKLFKSATGDHHSVHLNKLWKISQFCSGTPVEPTESKKMAFASDDVPPGIFETSLRVCDRVIDLGRWSICQADIFVQTWRTPKKSNDLLYLKCIYVHIVIIWSWNMVIMYIFAVCTLISSFVL